MTRWVAGLITLLAFALLLVSVTRAVAERPSWHLAVSGCLRLSRPARRRARRPRHAPAPGSVLIVEPWARGQCSGRDPLRAAQPARDQTPDSELLVQRLPEAPRAVPKPPSPGRRGGPLLWHICGTSGCKALPDHGNHYALAVEIVDLRIVVALQRDSTLSAASERRWQVSKNAVPTDFQSDGRPGTATAGPGSRSINEKPAAGHRGGGGATVSGVDVREPAAAVLGEVATSRFTGPMCGVERPR